MKKIIPAMLVFLIAFHSGIAQKKMGIHGKNLIEIIPQLENKFHIKLIYEKNVVKSLKVYSPEGFTSDPDQTLNSVLKPLGLLYEAIKPGIYRIYEYEILHKRTVEQGDQQLRNLLSLYKTADQFNCRKNELRLCMFRALGINPALKGKPLHPIFRAVRQLDGYSVQNIAFQSFPGYYVTGTLYRPTAGKGPFPAILCPHGHFYNKTDRSISQDSGRYSSDMQLRCATLAKMGAVVLNYDMYSWGESVLQTGNHFFHYEPFSMAIQTWNSIRCLDFLFSLPMVDKKRIGITGASGGGSQTIFVSALDDRIAASVPVVMISSNFDGGCQCESGLPVHLCGKYQNNNVEIAAMMAPRPQLLISEEADWTRSFPKVDFPFLQKIYSLYNKLSNVKNEHLKDMHHDYGLSKRKPMYEFFYNVFGLRAANGPGEVGNFEQQGAIIVQSLEELRVFPHGLPENALKGDKAIREAFQIFFKQNY